MRAIHVMSPVLFILIISASLLPLYGQDCSPSSAPRGFGGAWAKQYRAWCEACGGTYYSSGPTCDPGPNWGGRQQQTPSYTPQPSYDYEAERQRQLEAERRRRQELEEQVKREEEEAKKRQQEFERNKQEALKSMKGIAEGELGLKGTDAGGLGLKDIGDTGTSGLGLKDVGTSVTATQPKKPDCEWGNMGSSVVDLRCLGLDPNKPISVDPTVVRGKERTFPVQPDPTTFENVNYNKGFEALMRFDAASAAAAVQYFEQAQKERPKDPLIRNALLLAQDILKARQKRENNDKAHAAALTRQTYAALMIDEMGSARSYITRARELDPDNIAISFLESTLAIIGPESLTAATPEKRAAHKLVGHSLLSMAKEDYAAATSTLEVASKLAPDDPFIEKFHVIVGNYEAGRVSANTEKNK
jgi:hypothetical protein